jgi:hypothetical protein
MARHQQRCMHPNATTIARIPNGAVCEPGGRTREATSIGFVDQQFIAEIHQHRMVLEIKPTAEDIETAVARLGGSHR